ncbi:ParB N-terminal domain-containing protein [Burkholderia multivorans]|uniref:ParB N-terminal domain-containing protein n=1 Tax=Burkholderia multivorans TaxID=87883 RepID=UPI002ED612A5
MATKKQESTKEIEIIAVKDLRLDPENPRLPTTVARTQEAMIDYLATTTSIEDLMSAIAENGYFPGEPLIAVKREKEDVYDVVEGNRRLTAVILLNDPARCSKPTGRMRELSDSVDAITELPVVVRESREEVLPYLGFRHITGVKQWEPLAKARYLKQLFDMTDAQAAPGDRYAEVASTIGSRRDHVKRNLDALAVYELIEREDFFAIEDLGEESIKFSILSTALADERIAAFVGSAVWDAAENQYLATDPIVDPKSLNAQGVRKLAEWCFKKDEKGNTVLGESRNLRQLAAVVSTTKALEALQSGASLEYAYRMTKGVAAEFLELLYEAEATVRRAVSMIADVDYSPEAHEVARTIYKNVRLIGTQIADKQPKDAADEF